MSSANKSLFSHPGLWVLAGVALVVMIWMTPPKPTESPAALISPQLASLTNSAKTENHKNSPTSLPAAPSTALPPTPRSQKLALLQSLSSKTLHNSNEINEIQEQLANRELIDDSRYFLLQNHLPFENKIKDFQAERIERVNHLVQALRWKANPSRSYLLEAITQVALDAKVDKNAPETARRAVLGDRVELLMALAEYAPEQIEALKNKTATDPAMHRILIYAIHLQKDQIAHGVSQ